MPTKKGDPRLSRKYREQRLKVLARDQRTCHYCQGEANTVDHIVPIKKGGDPVDMLNMVACCQSCNSRKGSRSQGVFLQRRATPHVFPSSISPTQGKIDLSSPFTTRPAGE